MVKLPESRRTIRPALFSCLQGLVECVVICSGDEHRHVVFKTMSWSYEHPLFIHHTS